MTIEEKFTGYSRGLAAGIAAIVLTGTLGALTFESVAAGPGRIDTTEPTIGIVGAIATPDGRRES